MVDAVRAGRFHVWPIRSVDQGMELLTRMPVGEPDADGRYPEDSVNGIVERRLTEFAERQRKFEHGDEERDEEEGRGEDTEHR